MAQATSSVYLTPGITGGFTLPNSPDFEESPPFRLETRLHDWSVAPIPDGSRSNILVIENGFTLQLEQNKLIALRMGLDEYTSGQGNGLLINVNGRDDLIVRVQRDPDNLRVSLEIWNIDGGGYAVVTKTMDGVRNRSWRGTPGLLGGAQTQVNLAYLRMGTTLVPVGTPPASEAFGNLLNWEFDGDTKDLSSQRVQIKTSDLAFNATPVYGPACSAGETATFRADALAGLSGMGSYALNGNTQLGYSWRVLSAPVPEVEWTTATDIVNPQFRPTAFGTYHFELSVTDSDGRVTNCQVKHGAVFTDANDIIQFPDHPELDDLFSPMLRFGVSPWPWYDDRHRTLAEFFGQMQDDIYVDVWNVALPGTIHVTKGSTTVTGEGTDFVNAFCDSDEPGSSALIIWFPTKEGGTGKISKTVASCDSPTEITLTQPYELDTAQELAYSRMTETERFYWTGNASHANFYDNVLAFYALYYRSGIDTYRDYARTLADRWWTLPFVDEGRTCSLIDYRCMLPRNRSMEGLVVRALDGRPEMWPGLRLWCNALAPHLARSGPLEDTREQAYQLNEAALCARFDPDPASRDHFQAMVTKAIDVIWEPNRQPGGYWLNKTYGWAPWNGQPGSVTVTTGSRTVVGEGTQWTAAQFPESYWFWVSQSRQDAYQGDPVAYKATFVDATHLTLNRPYEGASGSGRGWQSFNLVGPGTQPYMLGLAANAFHMAYLATGDMRARQYVVDIAYWLNTEGYRASKRGLYYGRYYPVCEPIRENIEGCSADPVVPARVYAGAVLSTFALAQEFTGSTALLNAGNNLFGAVYGKPGFGGPMSDQDYNREIDNGGITFSGKKAKDFGFLFGFSQSWRWPATAVRATRSARSKGASRR